MSQELRNLARRIAEKRGLDPELFVRLINQESGFVPTRRGAAGEIGLGQILPTTNADPGFGVRSANDLFDPVDNLVFSANYLKAMIDEFGGDVSKGVAAYNTGAGNVDKGVIPKSTQQYVSKIVGSDVPSPSKDSVIKKSEQPASRPSNLTDTGGITSTQQNQINKVIEDLFGPKRKKSLLGRPQNLTVRRKGQMSPLSNMGIPGMGNIAKYSAPGGVASLMKKKKTTTI